jgi:hypothetical protein
VPSIEHSHVDSSRWALGEQRMELRRFSLLCNLLHNRCIVLIADFRSRAGSDPPKLDVEKEKKREKKREERGRKEEGEGGGGGKEEKEEGRRRLDRGSVIAAE